MAATQNFNAAPPTEAPPPYAPPTYGSQPSPASAPSSGPSGINRQFPIQFNLYATGILGRKFTLGEHEESPFYSVTMHTGWSGNPHVVVHTTPDPDSPPLATAQFGRWSHAFTVTLPPTGPNSPPSELRVEPNFMKTKWAFSVEVAAPGGGFRTEAFVWKQSKGSEVNALPSTWGSGKKLVREGSDEIVAACTNGGMSMSKKFCFLFVGAGATGELGERWAVMAVTSALGIFEMERRMRAQANP
jgi:hypothetical protein